MFHFFSFHFVSFFISLLLCCIKHIHISIINSRMMARTRVAQTRGLAKQDLILS